MFSRTNQITNKLISQTRAVHSHLNQFQSVREQYLCSGILGGSLATMFMTTLYFDKKDTYTKEQRFVRNNTIGLTSFVSIFSLINMLKYLKK
jgi:hypothetical protein